MAPLSSRVARLGCILCLVALASSPAFAQPEPPTPPAPSAPEAPASTVDSRPTPPPQNEPPKPPNVDDPMLDPLPPPGRRIRSWQEALRRVRSQSSSMRIAAAQVTQAAGQSRQALARALPTLTGTASLSHHLLYGEGITFGTGGLVRGTIPDPGTTFNAGLQLRVPLLAAQAWHDHSTARHAEEATRLSSRDTERQAVAATADAIVSAVTAERLAEVSRVSLRSALSTLALTRGRARVGAATAFDVLRAEQEVALTRAQIVATDEAVRLTREALGLALGRAEPWGVTPEIRLDALARDAATTCRVETDVASRPDVVAARATVEVAERTADSTDYAYLPTIDAVSSVDYTTYEQRSANGEPVTWTVGALLTWQLYDGGLRYGTRTLHQGRLEQAREQLVQTRRRAEVEVIQARRAVHVAQQNLGVSRRTREIAQQSARLSRIAFVSGNGNSFDLIEAQKRLREAEIDLAVKEFELVRSEVMALLALASCDA